MKKLFTFFLSTCLLITFYSQSWVPLNSPFAANRSFDILTKNTSNNFWGLSGNSPKQFTKTTDGGATWSTGNFTQFDTAYGLYGWSFRSISAIDANTAWILIAHTTNMYEVWKTSDGGNTWVNQLNLGMGNATNVHFFNADVGIVIADPTGFNYRFRIYRTIDGGNNWALLPDTSSPETNGSCLGFVHYVNGELFFFEEHYVTGAGFRQRIFKSPDQGLTWSVLPALFVQPHNLMTWSDSNNGIVVERTISSNTIASMVFRRTNDGGQSWSVVSYTGLPLPWINDIDYVPGTNILLATGQYNAGANGIQGSWRSMDNGDTWTAIDPGVRHYQIQCYASGICYSIGYDPSLNTSTVNKMTFTGLNTEELHAPLFGIYPNPTSGELLISTSNKISTTTLYDLSGKIVLNGSSKRLDLTSLPKGVYILNVIFVDGSSTTEKVIKK